MARSSSLALIVAALLPASLAAQVGYPPEQSPYRDQFIGQTLTVFTGYLRPGDDPANVRPDPSMLFGLRYDVGIGGPSAVYGRYSMAPSTRQLLRPAEPAATRVESTPSVTTHMFEIGLDISLTGRKSWRNIMPSLTAGVGIARVSPTSSGSTTIPTRISFPRPTTPPFSPTHDTAVRGEATGP